MKKMVIIFAVCLSIGIENSYAQSAKDNKPAKTGVAATRSGPTKGRILNDEEIKKVKNLILRGYTCYVQDLYRHYELIGDSEKCSEWLKYGLEHEDMWCMCYMYAFRKDELSKSEAEKLKKIITKHKEEKKEYVFYTSEIFGIEWDE
jgi:hypothetical protein